MVGGVGIASVPESSSAANELLSFTGGFDVSMLIVRMCEGVIGHAAVCCGAADHGIGGAVCH